ncbi:MAG: lipoprotein [Hyphomonadaceae bacterium]
MRRSLLVLAAVLLLTACSTLQSGYDDRARSDCERENRGVERAMC